MEAAEDKPAEPMEASNNLGDLDNILSAADNLAEALDLNSPGVKEKRENVNGSSSVQDDQDKSANLEKQKGTAEDLGSSSEVEMVETIDAKNSADITAVEVESKPTENENHEKSKEINSQKQQESASSKTEEKQSTISHPQVESMETDVALSSQNESANDSKAKAGVVESVQPQSPRVIELLDDDDEDVAPPQAKRPTPELQEPKLPEPPESISSEDSKSVPMDFAETKVETKLEPKVESVVSSDDEESIYYDKECVNYECQRVAKKFFKAPLFTLNFYKIQRKTNKTQFVCNDCYDNAVKKYEVKTKSRSRGNRCQNSLYYCRF